MSYVYCSQCGFQNPEAANFCARCGAPLPRDQPTDATMAFTLGDDDAAAALEEIPVKGPTLVVRSGGGREGEAFEPKPDRTLIGRSPECDIFLDDVTVSRRHAIVRRAGAALEIEDLGSLNGTYVNRKRIESPGRLADGNELQIGKYRLTFFA